MNILILNVHSALNLGDEAIMRSTIQTIEQVYPGATITVAANDPESWRHIPRLSMVGSLCSWVADCRMGRWRSGMIKMPFYLVLLFMAAVAFRLFGKTITSRDPEKQLLLNAYCSADLVFSCGGGNFYAHKPVSPSLFWNLVSLAFALAVGKKVYMLPQSVGPIEGKLQRWIARQVIGRVRLIMVREVVSQDFVKRTLRINYVETAMYPDLAFGVSNDSEYPKLEEIGEFEGLSIGITVLDRASQNNVFDAQAAYEQAILDVALRLVEEHNAHIYLLVQCYGPSPDQDDRHVTARMYSQICDHTGEVTLLDTFTSAGEIKAALSKMDMVIATRMHTAIFSLLNSTPFILVGYQPKSRGLMSTMNLESYYCSIDNITAEGLASIVDDLLENRESVAERIAEHTVRMTSQVKSWIERIEP